MVIHTGYMLQQFASVEACKHVGTLFETSPFEHRSECWQCGLDVLGRTVPSKYGESSLNPCRMLSACVIVRSAGTCSRVDFWNFVHFVPGAPGQYSAQYKAQ